MTQSFCALQMGKAAKYHCAIYLFLQLYSHWEENYHVFNGFMETKLCLNQQLFITLQDYLFNRLVVNNFLLIHFSCYYYRYCKFKSNT